MAEAAASEAPQSFPSAGLPSVSVVVPVYNGAADLDRCLRALAGQTYAGPVQVVVADNASTDAPESVVQAHPGVVLVREERPGSYAARNTALDRATGTVVAFTDADCEPHPDWLEHAVRALTAEPRAAMVGGRVRLRYEQGEPRTGSELYESVHGFPQERYLADQHFAVTANMVTWRAVLDEVGQFDGSLKSRGDAQWGQRVHAAGLLQRYAPDAIVDHPARATWTESVTKWRRVARGKVANDVARGFGRRHFAGLVRHQLVALLETVLSGGAVLEGAPASARLRYVLSATSCRVVTIAQYTAPLVRLDGKRCRGRQNAATV